MKLTLLIPLMCVAILMAFDTQKKGDPVPNAEVFVELLPDNERIANVMTDSKGEFVFTVPNNIKLSKKGNFSFVVTPPAAQSLSKSQNKKLGGMQKERIVVAFKAKDKRLFKYILTWETDTKVFAASETK